MNILFFLACWKRPEITEICFLGLQRLKAYDPDRFRISALAVISEESMIPLCEKYSVHYVMHENHPLGKKKNAGLNECFKYEWDYLIELGSDDLLRSDLLDIYDPYMKQGVPLMGMKDLIFYNSETGEARNYNTADVFGMGRAMSRKMLQHVTRSVECEILEDFIGNDGQYNKGKQEYIHVDNLASWERASFVKPLGNMTYHLWRDTINQGLDQNSSYYLMQRGVPLRHIRVSEPMGMDIKSSVNIWKYNPNLGSEYDVKKFLDHCSEEERAKLEQLVKVCV